MSKVAISQSNYIPWKGYIDMIASVDVFVLYDDMQYTKRDWRNRNKIKTPQGTKWLSIPVEVKGKYFQKINETNLVHLQSMNNQSRSAHETFIAVMTFEMFRLLMGDKVEPRREFIEKHALDVKNLDI